MATKNRNTKSKSIQLLDKGWKVRAKAFGYNLKNIISQEVCQANCHRKEIRVRA